MANPEHVEIVKKGVEAIAEWRREHSQERLELAEADLAGIDLSGANLLWADLTSADLGGAKLVAANLNQSTLNYVKLQDADLSKAILRTATLRYAKLSGAQLVDADLVQTDLSGAILDGANFKLADLSMANLSNADLTDACLVLATLTNTDLSEANLMRANLGEANLRHAKLNRANLFAANMSRAYLYDADFQDAACGWTVWVDVDLSETKNLETTRHVCSSTVAINTVFRSKGKIPDCFLRGCGVPEGFIENMAAVTENATDFYTCFIAYNHKDKDFAQQLYDELQRKGIRCWLDEQVADIQNLKDYERGVRLWDKIVFCASKHSLTHPAVENEIESAFANEKRLKMERGVTTQAFIPVDLDGYIASGGWKSPLRDHVQGRVVADFTDWQNQSGILQRGVDNVIRTLATIPDQMEDDEPNDKDDPLSILRSLKGKPSGLLSGFDRLITNDGGNSMWYNYKGHKVLNHHLRQRTIGSALEWETPPIQDGPASAYVSFVFAGTFGALAKPETEGFVFLIDGAERVDFDLARDETVWQSDDKKITLMYVPKWRSKRDSAGFFYVAVANEFLTAGQPCRFAVRSKGSGSMRWFGLQPLTDAQELQAENP